MQRTFSIIKPDAVRKGYTAAILAEIEKAGFKIVAIKKMSLSKAQAEGFYARPRRAALLRFAHYFMSSGSIFPMVLEKDNAIADLRKLMGATNPANAKRAPSASSSPARSRRMPSTAPTPKTPLPSRSATSSPVTSMI